MLDIIPYIDINKECVIFMPSYIISLKGDFSLKSPMTLGYPC